MIKEEEECRERERKKKEKRKHFCNCSLYFVYITLENYPAFYGLLWVQYI